ncbi:iron chelate uptake ABC transporter family permease subunit [Euzebya sp.]|uniref:iron chelate uptake ABC transporter family permease subunit n=1 Tax=Euzebya sp. TaxID=1971409 RepID=UPI0035117A50
MAERPSPAGVVGTPAAAQDRGSRRRPAGLVLGGLAVLALAMATLFMTWDLQGSLSFALRLRGTKLAAMALMGTGLGVATVIFHTVTANRILSPSIIGLDRLYELIQSAAAWLLGVLVFLQIDVRVRFLGEALVLIGFTLALTRVFLRRTATDLHRMLLVGVVFGAVFTSLSALVIRLIEPSEFTILVDRFYADFAGVDDRLLVVAVAVMAIALTAVWRMADTLDVVALGRDLAVELGVDHRRVVDRTMVAVAILVAVPTALVGPVTFLGLLVSNLAYQVTGTFRHRVTIPAAALLGVTTLVAAQFMLEELLAFQTRASIVVSFVGGVVFLVLVLREART